MKSKEYMITVRQNYCPDVTFRLPAQEGRFPTPEAEVTSFWRDITGLRWDEMPCVSLSEISCQVESPIDNRSNAQFFWEELE